MLGNSFWRKAASCRWCKIGKRCQGFLELGILLQVGLNFVATHIITEGGARFSGIFPGIQIPEWNGLLARQPPKLLQLDRDLSSASP